jgi:hypothetical protein
MPSSSSAAPPKTTPTTAAPKPVAWLATLQQRFLEGRNCDVVVRVSIEQPAAKHVRTDDDITTRNEAKTQQQQQHHHQEEGLVIDIPCPSIILTTRSRYFDAALSGGYAVIQQRAVEIVLADAQAVEDLKLRTLAEDHAAAPGLSGQCV